MSDLGNTDDPFVRDADAPVNEATENTDTTDTAAATDIADGTDTTDDAADAAGDEERLPDWAQLSEPTEMEEVDVDILRVDATNGERVEELVEFEEADQGGGVPNLAEAELLDVVVLEEGELEAGPREPSPYDRPGDWFVVHTYAGYENKVKQNLASRVKSMNVEERIYEVVIPMEDVIEFKGGRKVVVQKKVFPGYLLVRMALDDESWYVVRNTPGVTAFVGNASRPTPLSRKEVESILGLGKEEPGQERKVRPRLEFEVGEQVRVVAGPFADFNGAISDIDVARSKLTVLVNIFGRETPVELELGQVAKL
jgi:transcription termination/antitermination protein NusG